MSNGLRDFSGYLLKGLSIIPDLTCGNVHPKRDRPTP